MFCFRTSLRLEYSDETSDVGWFTVAPKAIASEAEVKRIVKVNYPMLCCVISVDIRDFLECIWRWAGVDLCN
ncbi:MAG: hypothetical protein QXL15_04620 [Candidatus Korarchaeota archaeon]